MPLENHPEILVLSPYLNCSRFELNYKTFISFFFIVCLFVCAVNHGVNEGEPVEEFAKLYRESEYAEQYREPEPENEYCEQELPEGFEDGKSNLVL